jgi:hypothetical protein
VGDCDDGHRRCCIGLVCGGCRLCRDPLSHSRKPVRLEISGNVGARDNDCLAVRVTYLYEPHAENHWSTANWRCRVLARQRIQFFADGSNGLFAVLVIIYRDQTEPGQSRVTNRNCRIILCQTKPFCRPVPQHSPHSVAWMNGEGTETCWHSIHPVGKSQSWIRKAQGIPGSNSGLVFVLQASRSSESPPFVSFGLTSLSSTNPSVTACL